MRQRVLIALAFAGEPRLIIADEPTTALDVTVQWGILRLLRDMQIRHGAAVLFITHDLGIVAKICRTMTVLHAGRVLEQGMTADLLANPRHPYTRALLASTPRVDRPADVLQPIPRDLLDSLWARRRPRRWRIHDGDDGGGWVAGCSGEPRPTIRFGPPRQSRSCAASTESARGSALGLVVNPVRARPRSAARWCA